MIQPLACPRCGCHQVTRVNRRDKALGGGSVFLCVNCGTPVAEKQRQDSGRGPWVKLASVLGLFSLLLLSFGVTVVDTIVHPMDEPFGEQREGNRE